MSGKRVACGGMHFYSHLHSLSSHSHTSLSSFVCSSTTLKSFLFRSTIAFSNDTLTPHHVSQCRFLQTRFSLIVGNLAACTRSACRSCNWRAQSHVWPRWHVLARCQSALFVAAHWPDFAAPVYEYAFVFARVTFVH